MKKIHQTAGLYNIHLKKLKKERRKEKKGKKQFSQHSKIVKNLNFHHLMEIAEMYA